MQLSDGASLFNSDHENDKVVINLWMGNVWNRAHNHSCCLSDKFCNILEKKVNHIISQRSKFYHIWKKVRILLFSFNQEWNVYTMHVQAI